jgi:hypothetical protein
MFRRGVEYLQARRSTVIPALIVTSIVLAAAVPVAVNPTWRQNVWSFTAAYGPTALQKAAEAHHRVEMARMAQELVSGLGELAVKVVKHVHIRP